MASSQRSGGAKGSICFYATLFAFSDEAKKELAEKFEASSEGRKADRDNQMPTRFVLRFIPIDITAIEAFAGMVEEYRRKHESELQTDMFEETKFRRAKGTRLPMSDERSEVTTDSETDSEAGNALISHEVVKKEWSNGDMIDQALLKEIGDSTQCRLEPKPHRKTIVVKGENLHQVDLALAKLDCESISLMQKSLIPMIYNFECTEGETRGSLQLLSLRELQDRRLGKTLASPTARLTKNLRNFQVVVMIKNGIIHPAGQPRPIDRDTSAECHSRLWPTSITKSIEIKPFAEAVAKVSLPAPEIPSNPFLEPRKTGDIRDWVEQSATQAISDPFEPPPPVAVASQPETQQAIEPSVQTQELPTEQTSPRKRPGRMRKAKGAVEEAATDALEMSGGPPTSAADVDDLMGEIAFAAPIASMKAATPLPPNTQGESSNKTPLPQNMHSETGNQTPLPPKTSSESETNKRFPAFNPNAYRSAKILTPAPSVKSRASSRQSNQLPALQPPYMPAASTTSTITSVNAPWASSAVTNAREGQLIDFTTSPSAAETPKDRLGLSNEAASRQYKNTMSQRKPSGQVGSGLSGATASYEKAATQPLEMVRSARGKVDIRMTIGRLLIDPRSGTSEYRKTRFVISQWAQVFPNNQEVVRLETVVVERLTSLASDADFIVDLKLSSGRRMFIEDPCLRKVTYRIVCSTSHKAEDDVVIDVEDQEDAEGEAKIWKASTLYGRMDWHYPQRCWDCSLAIGVNNHVNREQRLAAQQVVQNLCIAPSEDPATLQAMTKVPNSIVDVKGIQLRQETHHRSTQYPDLALVLCQVQDFEIASRLESSDEYHAYTNSQEQMVRENRLWWEAALVSASATKLVKENEALGVGEKAGWTAKEIIELGVIRNMSYLARDIVTAIDSVGYHNKGPKMGTVKELSELSEIRDKSVGFW